MRGIGEKTGAALLERYGTLSGLIAAVDGGDPAIKGAQRTRLEEGRGYLDVAPAVVRVAADVPLPPDVPPSLSTRSTRAPWTGSPGPTGSPARSPGSPPRSRPASRRSPGTRVHFGSEGHVHDPGRSPALRRGQSHVEVRFQSLRDCRHGPRRRRYAAQRPSDQAPGVLGPVAGAGHPNVDPPVRQVSRRRSRCDIRRRPHVDDDPLPAAATKAGTRSGRQKGARRPS